MIPNSSRGSAARWLGLVWLGISLPAFWVLPALDDWRSAAPLLQFEWGRLLPGLFWRPFENLNLLLVGELPVLYPAYLHALTVIGHGASGWLVYALAQRLGATHRIAAIASALFLVHPGVCGVVWSLDGVIRACSTALGLGSVLAYLATDRRRALIGWLSLAFLATLWYEPSLRWFLAAPLIRETVLALRGGPANVSRVARGLALGLVGIGAYFLIRWAVVQDLIVASHDRYGIVLDPLVWVRHAVMLTGVSASTVDTVALLGSPPNLVVAFATLLLGLPLSGLVLYRCVRTWPPRALLLAGLTVCATLAPHLGQGHVSEFYAHPIAAVLVILFAGQAAGAAPPAYLRPALALFVVASLGVDAHKAWEIIRTGRSADRVGRTIARQIPEAPEHLCVVASPHGQRFGYSVFQAAPGPASDWGLAARRHWGWDAEVQFSWARTVEACPAGSDAALSLTFDGAVHVLRPARP